MRPPTPSLAAWLIAIISLVVSVSGALLVGFLLLVSGRAVAYRDLQRSLSLSDLGRSTRYVEFLHERPSALYRALLKPLPALRRYLLQEQAGLLAHLLLKVQEAVHSKEWDSAKQLVQDAIALNRESAAVMGEHARGLDSSLTEVEKWVAEVVASQERSREIERELTKASEAQVSVEGRFVLVEREFADLLSLSAPRESNRPLEFYDSGYLQDLPLMTAIEDGIADAATLKMELDRIGGRVRVQGPGAAELFAIELEGLRARSQSLRADSEELERTRSTLQDERAALISFRDRLSAQCSRALELATLTASKPPTPVAVEAFLTLLGIY